MSSRKCTAWASGSPFLTSHPNDSLPSSSSSSKPLQGSAQEPWGPTRRSCASGVRGRWLVGMGHASPRAVGWADPHGGPTCPSLPHWPLQRCPAGARDFRAEQCSQFDSQDFQGRRYKWLPYYGGEWRSQCPHPRSCTLPRPVISSVHCSGSLLYTDFPLHSAYHNMIDALSNAFKNSQDSQQCSQQHSGGGLVLRSLHPSFPLYIFKQSLQAMSVPLLCTLLCLTCSGSIPHGAQRSS